MKKKICIITSSRADYGLLKNLILNIQNNNSLQLQLIVSGSHLSKEYGYSKKEIINDKVKISREVKVIQRKNSPGDICKSFSLAINGFSEAYKNLRPDCLVYLGDRYEILAAAYAGLIHNIPKIHIHGGELTEGVIDDATRHAITKVSDFHFVSHKKYQDRVIQLGENPKSVYLVGAMGIENIEKIKTLPLLDIEKKFHIELSEKIFLVTLHPMTLSQQLTKETINNLLKVLSIFKDYSIIFTSPNQDTYRDIIEKKIREFIKKRKKSYFIKNLGSQNYFSIVKLSKCVIGNSSSGILEVPSFKIPTINIGTRQKGRISARSTINCQNSISSIKKAIYKALKLNFKKINNPYRYKNQKPSLEIIKFLRKQDLKKNILGKKFYDII
jgi:GDP/UDP-N,N'-diacetylbacillosamine 2-epimerase (hydrolysing)